MLGNDAWNPCLEVMGAGISIETNDQVKLVLSGGLMNAKIDGKVVHMNTPFSLAPGEKLKLGAIVSGNVGYLGIQGSLAVAKIHDSTATHVSLEIGTVLKKNLEIPFTSIDENSENQIPNFMKINHPNELTLRCIEGPEFEEDYNSLLDQSFQIYPNSNRVGIRLNAENPAIHDKTIISSGVVTGTIQLPQDGNPIIMMQDHQTTGGYPRVLQVITTDLDYLAQMRIGSIVRLRLVDLDKAVELVRARESKINELFKYSS